MRKPTGRYP